MITKNIEGVLIRGKWLSKSYIKQMLNYTESVRGEGLMSIIVDNIPTIDLSKDQKRQVVVDREKGRYLGHVSTTLLSDQTTIYAVYIMGHGRGQAVMKKSPDGGQTWSERLEVPESWSTMLQVPVIYRLSDEHGKERLVLFTGHHPIRMSDSEDNGLSWSELAPIGDFGGNVSMSDIIHLNNGRYMAFFHDDGRFLDKEKKEVRFQLYKSVCDKKSKVELYKSYKNNDSKWSIPELDKRTTIDGQLSWSKPKLIYESYAGKRKKGATSVIYRTISDDGGKTWGNPVPIASHKDAYLGEPGAFYSPDRKQLALIFRENTRNYNSFVSYSNDDGKTWCEPYEISSELTGDRHNICYYNDGRVVITFRDSNKDSSTHGDWVVWVGKYDDIINGNKGQYRIRLMKNYYKDDCGYSGLELLKDGTFVATSYGHWIEDEKPYIVSVRFKLEDLER